MQDQQKTGVRTDRCSGRVPILWVKTIYRSKKLQKKLYKIHPKITLLSRKETILRIGNVSYIYQRKSPTVQIAKNEFFLNLILPLCQEISRAQIFIIYFYYFYIRKPTLTRGTDLWYYINNRFCGIKCCAQVFDPV